MPRSWYNSGMSAIPVSSLLPSDGPLFRLSVEQYHAMIDAGVLTDDDPVELVEGVLVFKMPKKPPHTFVVEAVSEWIRAGLFPGWFFRQQEPITLEDGEPEPDGVIIRGPRQDYRTRHPGPADIALVIEVSDTTLRRDRGMKLRSYARASIQVYWPSRSFLTAKKCLPFQCVNCFHSAARRWPRCAALRHPILRLREIFFFVFERPRGFAW